MKLHRFSHGFPLKYINILMAIPIGLHGICQLYVWMPMESMLYQSIRWITHRHSTSIENAIDQCCQVTWFSHCIIHIVLRVIHKLLCWCVSFRKIFSFPKIFPIFFTFRFYALLYDRFQYISFHSLFFNITFIQS